MLALRMLHLSDHTTFSNSHEPMECIKSFLVIQSSVWISLQKLMFSYTADWCDDETLDLDIIYTSQLRPSKNG